MPSSSSSSLTIPVVVSLLAVSFISLLYLTSSLSSLHSLLASRSSSSSSQSAAAHNSLPAILKPLNPDEIIDYMDTLQSKRKWYSACVKSPHDHEPVRAYETETETAQRHDGNWATSPHNPFRLMPHDPTPSPSIPSPIPLPFRSISFSLFAGVRSDCAAHAWFVNDLNVTGWDYLHVTTNQNFGKNEQARAAGFLEGVLTQRAIYEHKLNEYENLFVNSQITNQTAQFIQQMTVWTYEQIAAAGKDDAWWAQAGLLYQQLQGMYDGYNSVAPIAEQLTFNDLIYLNYDGDMTDIQNTVEPPSVSHRVDPSSPLQDIMNYLIEKSHCSALIRHVGPELFASHITWSGYSSGHHIFKYYNMAFLSEASGAYHVSSYPAYLSSTDDWFQTRNTQLTILETTNDIVDTSLYQFVNSSLAPSWMRAVIATRLATNGKEWSEHFSRYNSGTYNNQWMIVDYKLFDPSASKLVPDTVRIASQMPGTMMHADVTHIVNEQGYWSSFNRPWFNNIYVAMGYQTLNETYGSYLFGYDGYFRHQMFARDAPNVTNLASMQHIMQLNDWQHDVLSANNSGFAIAARWDLSTNDPIPSLGFFYRGAWGAMDCKITSAAWMKATDGDDVLRVSASNGPTHQQQPPFSWLDPEWADYTSHVGLPDTMDFPFVQFHESKD